jgi:hypothetical protein
MGFATLYPSYAVWPSDSGTPASMGRKSAAHSAFRRGGRHSVARRKGRAGGRPWVAMPLGLAAVFGRRWRAGGSPRKSAECAALFRPTFIVQSATIKGRRGCLGHAIEPRRGGVLSATIRGCRARGCGEGAARARRAVLVRSAGVERKIARVIVRRRPRDGPPGRSPGGHGWIEGTGCLVARPPRCSRPSCCPPPL